MFTFCGILLMLGGMGYLLYQAAKAAFANSDLTLGAGKLLFGALRR